MARSCRLVLGVLGLLCLATALVSGGDDGGGEIPANAEGDSTQVATARMLLLGENTTSSSTGDLLTWRLKDTSILDKLANKLLGSEEVEARGNPNRSGQADDSEVNKSTPDEEVHKVEASKVVETRVAAPAQFPSRRAPCKEENAWACLTANETMKLRQKLLQDLETSYNAPLPSRIRYRLKKKPSIYTSKKPNIRFDIGIPDIYETEVVVTPKHPQELQDIEPTVGYPDSDYRVAADRKYQQFVPTPGQPQYLPLEALVTPSYGEEEAKGDVASKPYIPLSRDKAPEGNPNLVFRPPRRPPGHNRRRTNGLVSRPPQGRPHYFTPAPERVSIQAHLQYRRPVSFKFRRTEDEKRASRPTTPATRAYTTVPYPTKAATPHAAKASPTPHPEHSHKPVVSTELPQTYLPPSNEYVPPKTPEKTEPYAKPPVHYLPPNNDYVAPKAPSVTPEYKAPHVHTDPPTEYKTPHAVTPHTEYKAPAATYTEPPKEYVAPHASLPVTPSSALSQTYLPPNKEYIPPKQPAPVHHEPSQKYELPTNEYLPPKAPEKPYDEPPPRKYIPPTNEYLPPHAPEHKPHEDPHKVPPRHYLPPNKEYLPPPRRRRPGSKVKTPGKPLAQPPRKYLPPEKEYAVPGRRVPGEGKMPPRRRRPGAPGKRRRKQPKRPTPPSRTYLPPNVEYGTPSLGHGTTPAPRTYAPPPRTYEVPKNEYLPPHREDTKAHGEAPQMTTMASVTYTTPSRTYLPPQRDYHAPPDRHSTPSQTYVPPSNEYIPPKAPVTPAPAYVPPAPPKTSYAPPQLSYIQPSQNYELPIRELVTTVPKPEPHDTALPSWLMNLQQGKAPGSGEKFFTRRPNPTPPPGYNPNTSTRTTPAPGYEYTPPVSEYHPPKPEYQPPPARPPAIPTYTTPSRLYQVPVQEYLPPKDYVPPVSPEEAYVPPKAPEHVTQAYVPPSVTEVSKPKSAYAPPPPPPIHIPIDPTYLPPPKQPSVTYLPPNKEYVPPNAPHATPPPPPSADLHIIAPHTTHHTTPKPTYHDVVSGTPHAQVSAYVPPAPPKPEYVPPAHPTTAYVPPAKPTEAYVPPAQPKPEYVPPVKPEEAYVPPAKPTQAYVPPAVPKPDYVPPAKPHVSTTYVPPSPKPDYVPPATPKPVTHHVTTYKPAYDPKIQKLQDFAHPGISLPPRPTARPNYTTTTYSPPVYTPTTYGPGYNDLPASVRPPLQTAIPSPPHTALHALFGQPSYYDDYDYYYDDYYDYDYDYYYDDDYYYDYDYDYYYDDYDYSYGPPRNLRRPPIPHHLIPQSNYLDILENEIKDYGYIAGIPGRAGRDYPILSYIPLTSFGCDLVADYPGYYADMEAGCQVFHICHRNGRQDSFLCPNGTVFNQKYFVCDWWYNFACEDAPFFYPVNAAIGHPGVPLHKDVLEADIRASQILNDPHLGYATPAPIHHQSGALLHQPLASHHVTAAPHIISQLQNSHGPPHHVTAPSAG